MSQKSKKNDIVSKLESLKNRVAKNNHETDLLSQIHSYNFQKIQSDIVIFQDKLQEQKLLEQSLNSKNSNENLEEITEFMEQYKPVIKEQLENLQSLDQELRSVVANNQEKLELDQTYQDMLKSPDFKNVAEKIRDITSITSNMQDFLVKRGLNNPKI